MWIYCIKYIVKGHKDKSISYCKRIYCKIYCTVKVCLEEHVVRSNIHVVLPYKILYSIFYIKFSTLIRSSAIVIYYSSFWHSFHSSFLCFGILIQSSAIFCSYSSYSWCIKRLKIKNVTVVYSTSYSGLRFLT